jgi:hypothetical protein
MGEHLGVAAGGGVGNEIVDEDGGHQEEGQVADLIQGMYTDIAVKQR